jgi:hypothetical protein
MILKTGAVIITGALLGQVFGPTCSTHDKACEALAEPWHTHHELPSDTLRVTGETAAVSNVSVGISYVKLTANIVSPKTKPQQPHS